MKKRFSTIDNMVKRNYQTPEITVFALESNTIMLNTSTAITNANTSDVDDLYYGGYDDEGEGD